MESSILEFQEGKKRMTFEIVGYCYPSEERQDTAESDLLKVRIGYWDNDIQTFFTDTGLSATELHLFSKRLHNVVIGRESGFIMTDFTGVVRQFALIKTRTEAAILIRIVDINATDEDNDERYICTGISGEALWRMDDLNRKWTNLFPIIKARYRNSVFKKELSITNLRTE